MTIDAIIPNYNGAHLFEKNLPAVWDAIRQYGGKLIVVDDGSKEEDKVSLKKTLDKYSSQGYSIEFVNHIKNKGFSGAVNSGVKASSAEFVALLNSDVVPHKDFLKSPLKKLQESEKLFGVGCLDESIELEGVVLRGRGIGHWEKGFINHSKGEVDKSDTFWISGGSSVIRRALYEKLGGLDELYNPFYWEDIDLSYRAQKAGYKIIFDKNSIVEHYHEVGAIKSNFKSDRILTISTRNQFIFIWKNITSLKLLTDHFINLPIFIVGAVLRADKTFLSGLFLALQKLPAIIKKRQKQKKFYQISDAEIINSFHD